MVRTDTCPERIYKFALQKFGLPPTATLPEEDLNWKAWFTSVCAGDAYLRKRGEDGLRKGGQDREWMPKGVLSWIRTWGEDMKPFQLHAVARKLRDDYSDDPEVMTGLLLLVQAKGGDAGKARKPFDKKSLFRTVQRFLKDDPDKYVEEYGPVDEWNVSYVSSMSRIFQGSNVSGADLSRWDVSGIKDMNHMFAWAVYFNGNVSRWDVSHVLNMNGMFSSAPSFAGDLSAWDVSNVREMEYVFGDANVFNSDISKWNVGKVKTMVGMFASARSFNADISEWDVSNVEKMAIMFQDARSFNRDLSKWDVRKAERNRPYDFLNNALFIGARSYKPEEGHEIGRRAAWRNLQPNPQPMEVV